MNRYSIIPVTIFLAVAVAAAVTWHWIGNVRQPGAAITSITTGPKVIAPAREIPPDVSQNMQAALAARQQKLEQLSKSK